MNYSLTAGGTFSSLTGVVRPHVCYSKTVTHRDPNSLYFYTRYMAEKIHALIIIIIIIIIIMAEIVTFLYNFLLHYIACPFIIE